MTTSIPPLLRVTDAATKGATAYYTYDAAPFVAPATGGGIRVFDLWLGRPVVVSTPAVVRVEPPRQAMAGTRAARVYAARRLEAVRAPAA